MIVNFEDYTQPLTDDEKSLISKILQAFYPNPSIAIKNGHIATFMEEQHGIRLTQERIQKILSMIRKMDIRWAGRIMVATSRGFFWTSDPTQIDNYIKSLTQRCDSTEALAEIAQGFRTEQMCNQQTPIV